MLKNQFALHQEQSAGSACGSACGAGEKPVQEHCSKQKKSIGGSQKINISIHF